MLELNGDKPRNFYQEIAVCLSEYVKPGTGGWHKEATHFRDEVLSQIDPRDLKKLKEETLSFTQTLKSTYHAAIGDTATWAFSYLPLMPNGSTLKNILESIAQDIPEQTEVFHIYGDDSNDLPSDSELLDEEQKLSLDGQASKQTFLTTLNDKLKKLTTKEEPKGYEGFTDKDRSLLIEQMKMLQTILDEQRKELTEEQTQNQNPMIRFNEAHWQGAQLPLLVDHMKLMKQQMEQSHRFIHPSDEKALPQTTKTSKTAC